jgi:hypothetical protein
MYYLKYAWKDIDWEPILSVLNINLAAICDNAINYWTPEQIKDMRDRILQLYTDENKLIDRTNTTHIMSNTEALLEFFNFYVEHNVYIYVW